MVMDLVDRDSYANSYLQMESGLLRDTPSTDGLSVPFVRKLVEDSEMLSVGLEAGGMGMV